MTEVLAETAIHAFEHTQQAGPVTPAPRELRPSAIADVKIQVARVLSDERGSLAEVYDERWGFTSEPVPYVYRVTLRRNQLRGWVVHLYQNDRLFFANGAARVALWDGRTESETHGALHVEEFGAAAPTLLLIPAGVYHAVRNIGDETLTFVNLPTQPYRHDDPDKYRLPAENGVIPYQP